MESEVQHILPSRTLMSIVGLPLLFLLVLPCAAGEPSTPDTADWALISQENDISIYSRTHPGGTLKEYKAVGTIDSTPRAIQSVLDDVDNYTHFMPYITQCKVIKREAGALINYQRVSPPFCTDRDYCVRVFHETKSSSAGTVYLSRWEEANSLGPAEINDVLRVKINQGSWLIEPATGSTAKVTYYIYTDSGGALPAWLATKANQIAINKLFEAIRKQAKLPKYSGSS